MERTIKLLKELRNGRGISQLDLSKEMRIDQKEISFLEHGKRPLNFSKIAAYLKAVQSIRPIKLITEEELRHIFDAIHEDVNLDAIEIISQVLLIPPAVINKISKKRVISEADSPTKTKESNFFKLFRGEKMKILLRFLSLDEKEQNTIFSIVASEELRNVIAQLNSIPKTKLRDFNNNLKLITSLIQKPYTDHEIHHIYPESKIIQTQQ